MMELGFTVLPPNPRRTVRHEWNRLKRLRKNEGDVFTWVGWPRRSCKMRKVLSTRYISKGMAINAKPCCEMNRESLCDVNDKRSTQRMFSLLKTLCLNYNRTLTYWGENCISLWHVSGACFLVDVVLSGPGGEWFPLSKVKGSLGSGTQFSTDPEMRTAVSPFRAQPSNFMLTVLRKFFI